MRKAIVNNLMMQATPFKIVVLFAVLLSIGATIYFFNQNTLLAYGDAESHLNISKRVTGSITPGLAQLGGIWLPLPHLLMVPFTMVDYLWRTGLAGAIVSGGAFVMASAYIFLLAKRITNSSLAGFVAFLLFALNPNILYMQSTALTEIPLVAFFMASSYYLVSYLYRPKLLTLVLAALFGFAATLTRYDGWFLVGMEALILGSWHLRNVIYLSRNSNSAANKNPTLFESLQRIWPEVEAKVVLFSSLAFVGILLWLLWDYLILGDPLYFTNSSFSAKSQQSNWLARGELPAYHNLWLATAYYVVTAYENIGSIITATAITGGLLYFFTNWKLRTVFITTLLLVPLFFNIITLYLGQSVIFIPSLTPQTFEWTLFNVRYGTMMIPAAAIFSAYLFQRLASGFRKWWFAKTQKNTVSSWRLLTNFGFSYLLVGVFLSQYYLFASGSQPVISYEDGIVGLSTAKQIQAQDWIKDNYDHGLVLIDDYARTMSIIRSGLPMDKVIYIGNRPYWQESLQEPEKYVRWIVMQDGDTVWNQLYENPDMQGQLYKYFAKAYTSPKLLIFKRNDVPV